MSAKRLVQRSGTIECILSDFGPRLPACLVRVKRSDINTLPAPLLFAAAADFQAEQHTSKSWRGKKTKRKVQGAGAICSANKQTDLKFSGQ